jgi:pyruvate formate lyase activating enzyme
MHGKKYSNDKLYKIIKQNKKCCSAVVLTGGEPTLQDQGCEGILRMAKDAGYKTMLNTNGSQPMVILDLTEKNLIDKIAMDVKAPFFTLEYQEMTGTKDPWLHTTIVNTIHLINKLDVDLELRTTAVKDTYSYGKHLYSLIDQISTLTTEWHLQQFDDTDCLDKSLKGKVPTREELLPFAQYAKSKGIPKVVLKTKLGGYEEIV